jgi:hypothetical protein
VRRGAWTPDPMQRRSCSTAFIQPIGER